MLSWFIENSLAGKTGHIPVLTEVFPRLIELLEMIRCLGRTLSGIPIDVDAATLGYDSTVGTTRYFLRDRKSESVEYIKDWLRANARTVLRISDRSLNPQNLALLQAIPQQTRVTCMISPSPTQGGEDDLRAQYRQAWADMCHQTPPSTVFYGFVCSEGGGPLNRYLLVGDECGLELDVSLSCLDSEHYIRTLDRDDSERLVRDYFNQNIMSPPTSWSGQPVRLLTFTL